MITTTNGVEAVRACSRAAVVIAIAQLAAGCWSPVQDDAIDDIGPEPNGLEEGPLHYPGEACLACHGGYGPGEPTLVFGGTVYATPSSDVPVEGARIVVTDSAGTRVEVVSNCAGNFYATSRDARLVFPLRAEVECTLPDGTVRRSVMGTRIHRDGSCASCHERGPAKPTGPAQVYCVDDMPEPPFVAPAACADEREERGDD